MKKTLTKIIISIISLLVMCLCFSTMVNAADTQTATSTINGVTVNWTYTLNDAGQIENLKCTNPSVITGNINIPSTLDGKTVVEIGNEAFKSATNVTGVTIPNSITKIKYNAFENCTKLSNVDLGSVENLSFDVFKGCSSLTAITIPKTLKNGSSTPCLNNTNITSITLEEGLTVIPSNLCANTGITSIKIPNSVKKVEFEAFANCTKLTKVDLGSIESLSFDIFKGCSSLTAITIPKTLKNGAVSPCLNNMNITSITLEEGLTVVPQYLCANTGITNITIPNSVKEIGYRAFADCPNLTKATILDNCTSIGWFTIEPKTDSVFNNHNNDLTIYCYEGSKIAEYAIATNIKYQYLTRPTGGANGNEENPSNEDKKTPSQLTSSNGKDDTISSGKLPYTGHGIELLGIIAILIVGSSLFYFKYKRLKGV